MKNHTPGPWHLASHRPNLVKVETARVVICDAFGGLSDETMANARLIASAPDLLAALERAVEWLEAAQADQPDDWEDPALDAAVESARAIIAEAKGGVL